MDVQNKGIADVTIHFFGKSGTMHVYFSNGNGVNTHQLRLHFSDDDLFDKNDLMRAEYHLNRALIDGALPDKYAIRETV